MEFPPISEVADAIKGMFGQDSAEATTDEVSTDAPVETTEEPTIAQEPETQAPESSQPETTHATVARLVQEKGARAFLADLPEDVRKQLGPELNKEWYTRLNERDNENKRLSAQVSQIPDLISKVVADQFDAIRMESMSEEDKKGYLERKELDRLRAAEKTKENPVLLTSEQMRDVFAGTPLAPTFWQTVKDVGLPVDPSNPEVVAFFNEVLREFPRTTSAEHGTQVIKQLATKYRKQAPAPAQDIEALVAKKVAEALEAAVDKKLKSMGALRADTGKASSVPGKAPTSWDQARKESEEELRKAFR